MYALFFVAHFDAKVLANGPGQLAGPPLAGLIFSHTGDNWAYLAVFSGATMFIGSLLTLYGERLALRGLLVYRCTLYSTIPAGQASLGGCIDELLVALDIRHDGLRFMYHRRYAYSFHSESRSSSVEHS